MKHHQRISIPSLLTQAARNAAALLPNSLLLLVNSRCRPAATLALEVQLFLLPGLHQVTTQSRRWLAAQLHAQVPIVVILVRPVRHPDLVVGSPPSSTRRFGLRRSPSAQSRRRPVRYPDPAAQLHGGLLQPNPVAAQFVTQISSSARRPAPPPSAQSRRHSHSLPHPATAKNRRPKSTR
ncbi:unnamed protein product [Linum trigynum]|uniref:Uncharacterized protein n=1 Tax=Linum trigynum TaxID=586398 RepID=A0AAV2F719_9ROSI